MPGLLGYHLLLSEGCSCDPRFTMQLSAGPAWEGELGAFWVHGHPCKKLQGTSGLMGIWWGKAEDGHQAG